VNFCNLTTDEYKILCFAAEITSWISIILQQPYGDRAIKQFQVEDWHKRFRDGRETIDDDPRSGRPSTSTNEATVKYVRGCEM